MPRRVDDDAHPWEWDDAALAELGLRMSEWIGAGAASVVLDGIRRRQVKMLLHGEEPDDADAPATPAA